jgi:hypothetical protein
LSSSRRFASSRSIASICCRNFSIKTFFSISSNGEGGVETERNKGEGSEEEVEETEEVELE